MLLDVDKLSQCEGGTFYVTTLLIRRVRELLNGSPKLVKTDLSDPIQIAFEELSRGKLLPSDAAAEKVEE
ncbi:MAG: DNA-directed RNA polymerase subunit omega [Candidatus Scalindua sp.]|nr:DNA-directed RNA polymerase subunit omega [Candidatus Scalindua sp.]